MTDRELLEKAAKAAGIEVPELLNGRPSPWYWIDDHGIHKDISGGGDGTRYWRWNPLTDDGDALRLAVKLGLEISVDDYQVIVTSGRWFEREADVPGASVPKGGDDYAATRRAIVRAAAAMVKE